MHVHCKCTRPSASPTGTQFLWCYGGALQPLLWAGAVVLSVHALSPEAEGRDGKRSAVRSSVQLLRDAPVPPSVSDITPPVRAVFQHPGSVPTWAWGCLPFSSCPWRKWWWSPLHPDRSSQQRSWVSTMSTCSHSENSPLAVLSTSLQLPRHADLLTRHQTGYCTW